MKRHIRKIIFITLISLFCAICQIGFASETPKRIPVDLFYKVADTILQCQNKEENIVAYLSMADPLETPLLVLVKLEGTGTAVEHYQNAFGAKVDGVAPSTFVHIQEAIADKTDNWFYGWDYGKQEYTEGTFSLGQIVAATDTDPRRNAKNAIKAAVKDVCSINQQINKYANPEAYEIEKNRFYGNFKKADMIHKKQKEIQDAKEAPLKARVEKFVEYVHNHPELGITNLVDANSNNLPVMEKIINMYIASGLYKEQ